MFKKTIKFTNFNDEDVEKDFYFHMSKAELVEMAANGEMQARLTKIMNSNDNQEILREFTEIIRKAVGIRSEDGERFIKSDEARSQLFDSAAFDELIIELMTGSTAAADFVKQLIPEKMQKEMQAQIAKMGAEGDAPNPFAEVEDARPRWMREHRQPTPAELQAMSKDEILQAMQYHQKNNG
jgi:hypothetical protein